MVDELANAAMADGESSCEVAVLDFDDGRTVQDQNVQMKTKLYSTLFNSDWRSSSPMLQQTLVCIFIFEIFNYGNS